MRPRDRGVSLGLTLAVLAGGGVAHAQPQGEPRPLTEPPTPAEPTTPAEERGAEKAERAAAVEAEIEALKRPTPVFARELLRAPRLAFEVGLDLGYTQGFGGIGGEQRVGDLVDAGLGVGVSLGYRATPGLAVCVLGGYQYLNADEALGGDARARGISAGIGFVFHLAPFRRIDPVITVGTGYRGFWVSVPGAENDVVLHGLALARSQVGLEVRVSADVALGPFAGADLDVIAWQDPESDPGGVRALGARRFSTFLYAGIQGRFNLGGSRDQKAPTDIDLARR